MAVVRTESATLPCLHLIDIVHPMDENLCKYCGQAQTITYSFFFRPVCRNLQTLLCIQCNDGTHQTHLKHFFPFPSPSVSCFSISLLLLLIICCYGIRVHLSGFAIRTIDRRMQTREMKFLATRSSYMTQHFSLDALSLLY